MNEDREFKLGMLGVLAFAALAQPHEADSAKDIKSAIVVPDLRLPDVAGKPRALQEWAGRPVLLNYWASWCGPCLKEIPDLQRFSKTQSSDHGVQVVGIALDDVSNIRTFLSRVAVDYPVLIEHVEAGEPGSSLAFGNTNAVLPYSVLLDKQGRVVRTKLGALSQQELTEWSAAPSSK